MLTILFSKEYLIRKTYTNCLTYSGRYQGYSVVVEHKKAPCCSYDTGLNKRVFALKTARL